MGTSPVQSASPQDDQRATQWQRFFTDFTQMSCNGSVQEQDAALCPQACAAFFSDFAKVYAAYMTQGRGINIVELAGIGQDELRNCSLLAWLLDCSGSHGQGAAFLQCFLDCIRGSDCPEGFPAGTDIPGSYRTTLESSYDEEESGKQRSRVDIELDGNTFLLFIEAKIQAGEEEKQLTRYLHIGRTRTGKRPWGLAFVTPSGRAPAEEEACGKVACVSWRTLGKGFLRHAETMPETHGSVVIRQICEHFISL